LNIVLIGYRGAGKSRVGMQLAERLGREFIDTDRLIEERQGASIGNIVKSHGWEHFRNLEKRVIEEIAGGDPCVIAPGGGAVTDPGNVRRLKERGLVIWLKAKPEVLAERMGGDPQTDHSRPSLTGRGILEEIVEVLSVRNPLYERAADFQIDTSNLGIEEVLERILSILSPSLMRAHGSLLLHPFGGGK
jgi:shikimate kinase